MIDRATPSLISQVHNLQKKVKFDEPANIQFTSVLLHLICLFVVLKILLIPSLKKILVLLNVYRSF